MKLQTAKTGIRTLELRNPGTLESWNPGTLEHWKSFHRLEQVKHILLILPEELAVSPPCKMLIFHFTDLLPVELSHNFN